MGKERAKRGVKNGIAWSKSIKTKLIVAMLLVAMVPLVIAVGISSASSSVGRMRTPLPAHSPSAFRTQGGCRVLRKEMPSANVAWVNVRQAAVGMPCRCMKPLAKSLLPSSTAPFLLGPMTGMPFSRSSSRKKSQMPFTNGSSGPTTTIEICFSTQNAPMPAKSLTLMPTFSPTSAVPALPGAMQSFSHLSL